MKCPECGAQVEFEGNATATECPYCKTRIDRPAPQPSNPLATLLEDKNGNGIPDFLETMAKPASGLNISFKASATVNQRYVVNGVEYHSLDEMPPEARKAFESASGVLEGKLALGPGALIGASPSASTSSVSKSFVFTKRIGTAQAGGKKSKGGLALFLFIAAILFALFVLWLRSGG